MIWRWQGAGRAALFADAAAVNAGNRIGEIYRLGARWAVSVVRDGMDIVEAVRPDEQTARACLEAIARNQNQKLLPLTGAEFARNKRRKR